MHHRLCSIAYPPNGLHSLRKGDKHTTYTPVRIVRMAPFIFLGRITGLGGRHLLLQTE